MATDATNKAIARVKKRIKPVAEVDPYLNLLLYGRNGKGKTRIAASHPKTLLIDVNEKGTMSVQNYPGVDVFPVKQWADLTHAYWFLREGDHAYEAVVIDTVTQMQHMCLGHVLKRAEDRDPNRPISMPVQRDWGQMTQLMQPLILNYRNLDMHTIFVCQERVDKRGGDDEDEATSRIVPDLSPGVRGTVMASVGIMGRVYQASVRRGNPKTKKEQTIWQTRVLLGPHDDYETKDRSGVLKRIEVNPTMATFIEAAKHINEEN